ncbi:MAG: type IV pilus secretin PilQ [Candidatus Accumulibacter sp.]|jgi:type IV pilus assembly protein PilQ|nr:type IV pilus secretin PilQ [Accumulibacter sp.]
MKHFKHGLLGAFVGLFLVFSSVGAQDPDVGAPNALETIGVAQQGGVLNVRLGFKEALTVPPSGFSISMPARIALDFDRTTNGLGKTNQVYNQGDLRSVNIASVGERTRLVLNLNRAMNYETAIEGKTLLLTLSPSVEADSRKGGVAQRVEHFAPGERSTIGHNSILDISFRRGQDGEGRITVDLSNPNTGIDLRQEGKNLVVDFIKMTVPDGLRKRLDVTDFATPIQSVNTVQHGANARMTVASSGLWEHNAYQTENQFVIEVKPIVEDPNKLVQGSRGGYQGEKLSLNFQNVDVRRLLQVIGEFTGINMVVSDSVSGSITLVLKDVAWDQALDIIMRQKGLDMRKNGNVILIAPREEINTKEKLEYEAKSQISELAPMVTEGFQLNYVKGSDLRRVLIDPRQTLLSKRGTALVDERSNMIFVTDVPERVEKIRMLLQKIDIPVRQVMIEARIVEATDNFSRELGTRLRWGGTKRTEEDGRVIYQPDNPMSTVDKQGILPINRVHGAGYSQGGGTNLPGASRLSNGGAFALTLYNSNLSKYLSAEIAAIETDGRGKVIASPRVMTANQSEAIIEQGVEIPFQQATSSGATSVMFKKANLSLKVKPQITPDGKITMTLDINKDTPDWGNRYNGMTPINTQHVQTEVLIENGGTVVIGGIFKQDTGQTTNKVPFFGDLPYLGWLFKDRTWNDSKNELLVFITPRVVVESLAIR